MRTDRRTDLTKLVVTFRNFAQAPKYVRKFTRTGQKAPDNSEVHMSLQNCGLPVWQFVRTMVPRI